jgi:hypothetical protein
MTTSGRIATDDLERQVIHNINSSSMAGPFVRVAAQPASLSVRPPRPVVAFAGVRLTLHSSGDGDSEARLRAASRDFGRGALACVAAPAAMDEGLTTHPLAPNLGGIAAEPRERRPSFCRALPFVRCHREAAQSCFACGPARTPVRAFATVLLTHVAMRALANPTLERKTGHDQ